MKTFPNSRPAVDGHRTRRLLLLAAAAALTIAAWPATPATAAPATAAPAPRLGYQGHAFGTYVTASGKARSGPSSVVALGCGAPAGFRTRNAASTVAVPATLASATLATTGSTSAAPDRTATTARADHVNLLAGRVTAASVKAVSIATHDSTGYHTSAVGTTFADLMINGVPMVASPPPNTTVTLPGVGHVVLNEQHSAVTSASATMTVFALHGFVTEASPSGAPVGTNAIVAGAFSAITAPTNGFLAGTAYGSEARVGNTLTSGPSFSENLPCAGTGGQLRTNTGAGATTPTYATTGATTNTARGTATATIATGETTSTVATGNFINGLVKATRVKADAHVTRAADGSTMVSDAGSGLGSVTVNGKLLPETIKPNTVMQIPGVGTLTLHHKVVTATSIRITMLELVVTKANPYNFPVGTDLKMAVAEVSVH